MSDDLAQVLDTAVFKEIASQALYIAAQAKTRDPAAITLMKELADEEFKHSRLAEALKSKGGKTGWQPGTVRDLMISDYLIGPDTLEGAGLQDTLIFAMKRELQSIQFYSQLMSIMRGDRAKRVCQRLAAAELGHKRRLEVFYDNLVFKED